MDELVKSLRICASEPGCDGCKNHVADEHYEIFNSCTSGAEGLMKEAADAIEELLQKTQQLEWIPVTERLPESGENVLSYWVGGEWKQLSWYSLDKFVKCNELTAFYPFSRQCFGGNVTHWMPLPEPPKEEQT